MKMLIDADKARLEHLRHHLGHVRQWIEGFEASGKKGPVHADAIRQLQILIQNAVPGKAVK